MVKVKILVYQAQEKGCGFATVKMALIYMSKDRRFAFLPEPKVEVAPDLAELLSYAEEAGLHLRAYHAEPSTLRENAEFPLLLLLSEEGRLHMGLLLRQTGEKYLFLDPAKGKRILTAAELSGIWTGDFLRIEGYEKKGGLMMWDAPKPSLGSRVFSFLSAFLPMAALAAGLTTFNDRFPSYVPLLCFALAIAVSLLQKVALLKAMARFDATYMAGIDAKDLKRRRDLFVRYHAYKRAAFVHKAEVLGLFASTFAVLLFFFFHDLYLALAAAVGVGVLCLVELILKDKRRYLEGAAESAEGHYLFALVNKPRREELRAQVQATGKAYARLLLFRQSGVYLLSLVLAVSFSFFGQGGASTLRVLFYLLSLSYLLFETTRLLQSGSLLEEKDKEEPYFLLNIAHAEEVMMK